MKVVITILIVGLMRVMDGVVGGDANGFGDGYV